MTLASSRGQILSPESQKRGNELPETSDISANPLNEDPPSSVEEFARDFNYTVDRYIESVSAYQEAVDEVEKANELGERVVNLILINASSVIENATVTGLTAILATPPALTAPPSIPPTFENATINGEPAVIPVDEIVTPSTPDAETTTEEQTLIPFTIPVEMRVTMEPQEETGHLVHVAVTVFDNSGQPVPNLGLVNPWMCEATLLHDYQRNENAPQLEGQTSVPFVDGVAEFTRLRVDRPSQFLTLDFKTNPRRFDVQTSVQFEVVGPPENTQRERVMFVLAGNVGALTRNEVEIKEAVRVALGRLLDVDVSRLQDIAIMITRSTITVEVDLLERHPTDPPNVPYLNETITQLQTLVNSQQLVVTINGDSFVAVSSSFGYPTSPSPTSPTSPSPVPTNFETIIIVVCSTVGGVFVVAAIWFSAYLCSRLCRKSKGKEGQGEEKRRRKGKGRKTRTKVEEMPTTIVPLRLMVENPIAEDSDTSSGESDIYLERTKPFHKTAMLSSPTPPHVLTPAESFFDSGKETQQTSLDTMNVEMPQGIFTNQYADCWSDTLPPVHHGHKPTVTLGGLANPAFGLQPPAWSPAPPPMTSVPPDWKKPGAGAHKMAAKGQ